MTHELLGRRVRELREAKGMTLRQVAEKAGVSVPFLSDLEHGRRGTDKLDKIAAALGADVDELAALDGRVSDDLKEWIAKNPGIVALLRHCTCCERCRCRFMRASTGCVKRRAVPGPAKE